MADTQIDDAFEFCKEYASADGAFDDGMLRLMFSAAWDLCAQMVGHDPPRQVEEVFSLRDDGSFVLSYTPTSEVRIYAGYQLLAVLPPSLERSRCDRSLCCHCRLVAKYTTGKDECEYSSRFIQAVARLFAYMIENRGDSELDDQVLAKCGALAFLRPDLTFVL